MTTHTATFCFFNTRTEEKAHDDIQQITLARNGQAQDSLALVLLSNVLFYFCGCLLLCIDIRAALLCA